MEHTENTDKIVLKPKKSSSQYLEYNQSGLEVSNLGRFFMAFLVIVVCFLVLLWSRLELNEAQVALGKAQREYKAALEENQRLKVELSVFTSPASIQEQIKSWNLENKANVIDIFEAK